MLSVGGKGLIAQTGAIVRYCTSLVPQLVPEDPFDASKAESIYLAAEELSKINPLVNVHRGEDHARLKAEYFQAFPVKLQRRAKFIEGSGESIAASNPAAVSDALAPPSLRLAPLVAGGPFTLGSAPHYGDIFLYHIISNVKLVAPDALNSEPSFWGEFLLAVEGLEGIKDYLDRRPKPIDIGVKPMLKPNICGSRVVK